MWLPLHSILLDHNRQNPDDLYCHMQENIAMPYSCLFMQVHKQDIKIYVVRICRGVIRLVG